MKCPPFSNKFVFADDPKLAAQLCCTLSVAGVYLPVCDGPRMQRPDRKLEVLRRHNAMGRTRANIAFMADLSDDAFDALRQSLASRRNVSCHRITLSEEVDGYDRGRDTLHWGRDRIGVGLLKALRAGQNLVFEDGPSPYEWVASKSKHMVVCEGGEELSQVIAANYAFALDAGLFLIPEVDKDQAEDLLEGFYKLYDRGSGFAPAEAQARLSQELLALCGSLPIPDEGSITFIGKLPFGFAYPEYPSTHLFEYPDLGCAVVNGFAAEQPRTPGTGVVMLVDPDTTPAPEIQTAVDLLEPRRAFIRVYQGHAANVRDVSDMMEHFPYDLLIIATHCGDSDGYRWTYEFTDSEGLSRTLVVDLAVGFARTDDPEVLKVGQYMRFISLDGVDWTDRAAKAKLYVGKAMTDFMDRERDRATELKPVKRDSVERVVGSAAMKMSDSNLLFAQHTMAGVGTPIVINNACLSWHRLAGNMIFGGARAYVGTLFPVMSAEAAVVVTKLLDNHWNKPLPIALWAAQRDVYKSDPRRPYVVAGVFPQWLRVEARDYPGRIRRQINRSLSGYREMLVGTDKADAKRIDALKEIIKFLDGERDHFEQISNEWSEGSMRMP
jgi:hypothetical protein